MLEIFGLRVQDGLEFRVQGIGYRFCSLGCKFRVTLNPKLTALTSTSAIRPSSVEQSSEGYDNLFVQSCKGTPIPIARS